MPVQAGLQSLEKVHALQPGPLVIIMTAYSDSEQRRIGLQRGVFEFAQFSLTRRRRFVHPVR